MKKTTLFLGWVCLLFAHTLKAQLPVWPLVTSAYEYLDFPAATVPNQFIDWTGVPVSTAIPGTGTNRTGSAQAGVDACNNMIFFVLHNGQLPQASSFLQLYTPTGTYMPLPTADMNCNAGDDEVQVIRRPGFSNQWFVVYSLALPGPWTGGHPGYECSNLAYSLIQVSGATATYVTDGFGDIRDRVLEVAGTPETYFHGKATSRQSVVAGYDHDIYIQRRTQLGNSFIVDRFSIDGTTSITHTGSSSVQASYWWTLMAAGSPIEISPDGLSLAVMARTQNNTEQEIYIFDISTAASLATAPDVIVVDELELEFTAPPLPLAGLFHQPQDFDALPGTNFDWLQYFEQKISGVEYSPSGQYLYITNGGFVAGGTNNITYLAQIDLSTFIGGNHPARVQVQTSDELDSYLTWGPTTGGGLTWPDGMGVYTNYWLYHGIGGIESSFDGNLYFTKTNRDSLFVIPDPDLPLPIDMTPHSVNLATPGEPNIVLQGYAGYLPDQIDGFDYSNSAFTSVTLVVSNQYLCNCDTLTVNVTMNVHHATEVVTSFLIDDCPDTITICVPAEGTLNLEGSNGVIYYGAIVNGVVTYPPGSPLFGFGAPGPGSAPFTVIDASNNYISNDQYWDGKYYISDYTILTVDNATLDLTNVDLVFGTCAGIDFINGGHVRANNSVFRPCAIDRAWRGLQFRSRGNYDNIINECTFKNAEIALYFQKDADGVISNNLFSNCSEGVRTNTISNFNHPISGNRFLIDDFLPQFDTCYATTNPQYTYGIFIFGGRMSAEISQNDFIYSRKQGGAYGLGIVFSKCGGRISENTFTNYRNPIVLSRPTGSSYIDNNEIEYSNSFQPYTVGNPVAGISVYQSAGIVEIANNELRDNSANVSIYGIYGQYVNKISAQHNMLDGFETGIYFYYGHLAEISENVLTDPTNTGIRLQAWDLNYDNYITCNDITMYNFQGAGIVVEGANENTKVISNCIKDSKFAMYMLDLSGAGLTIPYIRNNYLYNYGYGIYNDGHSGNIGSAADPGLNTLWSNNNASFDIASTTNIQVANNFGMFNITFPTVMITANNPYHSTASCGQQIFNMPSQGNLNTSWVCDNSEQVYFPLIEHEGVVNVRDGNIDGALTGSADPLRDVLAMIVSLDDLDLEEMIGHINTHIEDENDRNLALSGLFARFNNYAVAIQYLQAYTPANTDANEWKMLELLYMDFAAGHPVNINDYKEVLKNIANGMGPQADMAANLLHYTRDHSLYPYHTAAPVTADMTLQITRVPDQGLILQAYPNPVHDFVTISIITDEDISNYYMSITDVTGKKVSETPVQFIAGQARVDMETLSPGIYMISVHNDEYSQTVKFIKD